jgi:histidine ammonia-lyase
MIPQYVAAALVSENKVLAHPASVDSIPTSANQEDHVSMGTVAARQAKMVGENAKQVLAIELLNNTQAYEFRKPIELAPTTDLLYRDVRKHVNPVTEDRPLYLDIEKIVEIIENYNPVI